MCQDPAGNRTTRRSPDDRKQTQTAVVRSCLPFIRSGQNHLPTHGERGKKTRWTKEEVGRQHHGMDRPGVRQVPEGSGEQRKMGKTGCKIICGALTTLAVKGLMMMMRWKDTIREWTGLEFTKSQTVVENREKRRKLVVKSSVVPQQSSRLRTIWWWWWERHTRDQKVSTSNPGRRISFSRIYFVCWLLFGVCSTPVLPQWHVKDPGHCQKCRWQVRPKHAYTLDSTKSVWADYVAVQA